MVKMVQSGVVAAAIFGLVACGSDARRLGQPETNSTGAIGAAFNGGGFRAHAVHAGIVAGLMGAIPEEEARGKDAQSKLAGIFESTELLGCNSGGTWFLTQLVYSSNFADMLDEMASAENAAAVYYEQWTERLLMRTNMGAAAAAAASEANDFWDKLWKALGVTLQWSMMLIQYGYEAGMSWSMLVKAILELPGDLDAEQALNVLPPGAWATGKHLGIAGALVAPPDDASSALLSLATKTADGKRSLTNHVTVAGLEDAGHAVPLTFSTTLGARGGAAPFAFVDIPQDAAVQASMELLGEPRWPSFGRPLARKAMKLDPAFLGRRSNEVRLQDAATTSSSFLSQVVAEYRSLQLLPADVLQRVMNLTIPFSATAEPVQAFTRAAEIVQQRALPDVTGAEWLKRGVEEQLVTVADGGYVDNTGVSKLVGEAPDDASFVLFLNGGEGDVEDVLKLFTPDALPKAAPSNLTAAADLVTFTELPIFAEGQASAKDQLEQLEALAPGAPTQFLSSVRYGTVRGTTRDQPFFDVQAGKRITLHVVVVQTKVWLATPDWRDLPALAAEVIDIFKANSAASAKIRGWMSL